MESSARTRNAFLTVVGVLGAIVLVALASRGSTSLGDSATRKPSDALTDILFAIYIVALVGGVLGALAAQTARPVRATYRPTSPSLRS